MIKRVNLFLNIQFSLVLAMMFLVPLVFDTSVYEVFLAPKILLFEVLFFLWLIVWFVRLYIDRSIVVPTSQYLGWLILGFILILLVGLSGPAGLDQYWFGSALRGFGGFLHLELFILFLWVVVDFEQLKTHLPRINLLATLTGFLISLYGLVQIFGLDPLHWERASEVKTRASSTLGQPNFLASLLLMTLPLTWLSWQEATNKKLRLAFLLAGLAQLVCLIMTLSRGAWLAVFVTGLILYLNKLWLFKRQLFWLWTVILTILLSLTLGFGNINNQSGVAVDEWSIGRRLQSLTDFGQGSIRSFYYQSAVSLIGQKPLVGYGFDSLGYYFYPYYNGNWAIFEVLNQATDRAHNFWLDVGLESGMMGIVWWLSLIVFIIILAEKSYGRQVQAWMFALIATFISWQVSFVTLEPAIYWWLILGLFVGSTMTKNREVVIKRWLLSFVMLILLVVSYLAIGCDFERYQAGRIFRRVLLQSQTAHSQELTSIKELVEVATASDLKSFYGGQIYLLLNNLIQASEVDQSTLSYITGVLEEQNQEPLTFEWRINRLLFLSSLGREALRETRGQQLFNNLNQEFVSLKQSSSRSALVEFLWGNLYYFKDDCGQALNHYYQALLLYPALDNPQINKEHFGYIEQEHSQVLRQIKTCRERLGRDIIK